MDKGFCTSSPGYKFFRMNPLDAPPRLGHTANPSPVKRLAITGGIACGKSSFARFLSDLGCEILDADDVVHCLEAPGGRAVQAVLNAFGPAVLGPDGAIHRESLARVVFADTGEREKLNAIIHPLVRDEFACWFQQPSTTCLRFAVIPLLFEVGWRDQWDCVVCVACSPSEQKRRLLGRGLTEKEAALRINAQLPIEEKARLSDRVVWNDGSLEALRREAENLVRDLSEKQA